MTATASYRARWVIPVDQPPIADGIVTLAAGRIVAVGTDSAQAGSPLDLGDVALLPGLINAHTHLEFSLLDRPLGKAKMPFAEWIRQVVLHRRQEAKALFVETDGFQRFRRRAAQAGLDESRKNGVVALGDVATPGWPRECFPAAGLSITMFLELLGLEASQQAGLLSMAQSFVLDLQDAPGSLRPGLSPHAPYTASPALVLQAAALSAKERFPLAMHLAESRDELELLATHSGPLVETLQALSAWHPTAVPAGIRPLDYLRLLAQAHRSLIIHGNYLASDEIDFLIAHADRMSLIHCPRTHAYFGQEPFRLEQLLAAGVHLAIGTDSRASNPNLRLLDELRHLAHAHPALSPQTILELGTLRGAEALGIASDYGSITAGKRAELAVVSLGAASSSPLDEILHSERHAHPLAEVVAKIEKAAR